MAKIPIDIQGGSIRQADAIYGIDLGTTNSLVSIVRDGKPVLLRSDQGSKALVPSIVHFSSSAEIIVGDQAKRLLITAPERTIYSAKRLLGKSFDELEETRSALAYSIVPGKTEEDLVKLAIDGRYYSPVEISAEILKHLRQVVKQSTGEEMNRAVITVPAYFNDSQRQATRDAGRLAGLDVVRIINEPTAAALAHGIGIGAHDRQRVAVFDLGGGTFDVTILEIDAGVYEVLSTQGDTHLGGDDMEEAVMSYWVQQYDLGELDAEGRGELRIAAEEVKRELSLKSEAESSFRGQQLKLDRKTFDGLIKAMIERSIESCLKALSDAELTAGDIDKVLLVGGSTRVPLVRDMVEKTFGRKPDTSLDPDAAVALGAAVQADILAGNNPDVLLLDVTPLSLGIETMGRLMDTIIPRNTKVPYTARRQYTTSVDGQVNLRISVYQGERDLVDDNRKLGEFVLSGIPPMPAGIPKIEISFILDADGILQVSAAELRSMTVQSVKIKPSYGMSEEEMAEMLLDSLQHAEADVALRKRLEAINELRLLIQASEKFAKQNAANLSSDEATQLSDSLSRLRAVMDSSADEIQAAITQHDADTRAIAERMMDVHIATSLQGRGIDSAE